MAGKGALPTMGSGSTSYIAPKDTSTLRDTLRDMILARSCDVDQYAGNCYLCSGVVPDAVRRQTRLPQFFLARGLLFGGTHPLRLAATDERLVRVEDPTICAPVSHRSRSGRGKHSSCTSTINPPSVTLYYICRENSMVGVSNRAKAKVLSKV